MACVSVVTVTAATVLAVVSGGAGASRVVANHSCTHPVTDENLFGVRADGASCRGLLARPGAFHVLEPSPDRKRIAASGVDRQLLISNLTGTRTHAFRLRWAWDAAWSPNGRKLAVVTIPPCADTPCATRLWIVDVGGRGMRRLANDAAAPSWAPDSRRLAFISGFDRPRGTLTIANLDGERRELAPWQSPSSHSPPWGLNSTDVAWSPRGDWIAFDSGAPDAIRLIRPSGRDAYTLAAGIAPSWAPDGRRLAFLRRDANAGWVLWVIGRDRSAERRLDRADVVFPTWAPDGGSLAYAATRRAQSAQLFALKLKGGRPRLLVRRPAASLFTAIFWSIAGERIYFAASLMVGE